MSDMSISSRLAEWAADTPPIDDPQSTAIARGAFSDTMACMFGGMTSDGVRRLIQVTRNWDNGGKNTVFGTRHRFSPPWAALINGTAAHALDFDDNFIPAFTHASAVLVPALLALGESRNCTGKALLDAYMVGAELHTRIGLLVNPGHFKNGWHATATVGTIGTAGACARLLGLNSEGISAAMSIGFSLAAGSKKQFGTMMKPIHAGLAAQHAVMAASMAAAGINAAADFLTGELSFQEHYAEPDLSREKGALDGLGHELCLSKYGLLVKRFPCCGSAHKTLDGFLHLREAHQLNPKKIKRAITWLPETMSRNLRFDRPRNENEARFSLHYNAARILLEGSLSLQHFTGTAVAEPAVTRFLDRIQCETIPDPDTLTLSTPLLSRIELDDGSAYETAVEHVRGSAQNPLSPADIAFKFGDCIQLAGMENFPEMLFGQISSIDTCGPVQQLMDPIAGLMPETE
ncbi:MAG: MmgE/PrpD family protein [bacterium]